GSGKSTVGRRLANALDLDYLDTGAMYRSVTWAVLERGVDPADEDPVAIVAREVIIDLDVNGTVVVDGQDVTTAIRSPEVSAVVSVIAANQKVRAELVARQREWTRKRGGGVLDGRDIGTVVFPDATLKIYLTASTEARASRRALDEKTTDEQAVAADLTRRDALDSGRRHDPLRRADDAVVVDTSDLSIEQVVARLVEELGRR
ncbi:MAG: (d)CMP kinase, partial [Actinomycetia bacterium]|nr:(d)CMP kinase [Actinomycetes bacterium]